MLTAVVHVGGEGECGLEEDVDPGEAEDGEEVVEGVLDGVVLVGVVGGEVGADEEGVRLHHQDPPLHQQVQDLLARKNSSALVNLLLLLLQPKHSRRTHAHQNHSITHPLLLAPTHTIVKYRHAYKVFNESAVVSGKYWQV